MGRRKIREMPAKEEMANLYLTQGKRQSDMATHYGVSRDTIKDWLKAHGIGKHPERRPLSVGPKRPHSGRPPSDPKRVSWLDEEGEAPPLRPDVMVKPTAEQAFVITERRPKRAARAIATPPMPARPLRKIDDLPPSLREPARQAMADFVAYAQQRRARVGRW